MKRAHFLVLISIMGILSCTSPVSQSDAKKTSPDKFKPGSFGYDLAFLRTKDSVFILETKDGKGRIVVSAKYQGKVFTSTADGDTARSFGWVNYKAFNGKPDAHMNGYGGEDRLWLGPEGNKFSLFFKPGAKMEFEQWHTPAAFDTESWDILSGSKSAVSLQKKMSLLNYTGTQLKLNIERKIEIIERDVMMQQLGISLTNAVKCVGIATTNSLKNTGNFNWTDKTGAPCLWNLDMFAPAKGVTILIPYKEKAAGKIATTDYFGEIHKNRIHYKNGVLMFKADGKMRGKLGLSPLRAKNLAASYDAQNKVLTIVRFDLDSSATYLNQEWKITPEPLKGDAVNAYNDGPLADGKQMGPFYEIESVSPAAFLKPGAKLIHHHTIYHFTGNEMELTKITKNLLGLSVQDINAAFND